MGRVGQIMRIFKIQVGLEGQNIIMTIWVGLVWQIRYIIFLNKNSKY